ncbi:MAG: SurA N-terminal domain-containing protein [Patescibacteria group bacterium]
MAEIVKKKTIKKTTTSPVKNTESKLTQLNAISQIPFLRSRKALLAAAFLVAALLGLLYVFKGLFVVALVNGEPISRIEVIKALEKQGGKATLDSLVTKKLIAQEARSKNITISQDEIDEEIKKITENLKKQGTTIDKVLETQGMTKTQLNEEIKLQLSIQKMVGKDPEISDKELDELVIANKAQFPEGTTDEQMRTQSREQLKQQKIQQKTQEFIKSLQDKAKATYFVQY